MLMEAVSSGFRRRSPKAHESVLQSNSFFEVFCSALFVIKSEEVPHLLVVFAMRQRRVGDNRNALSGWRAYQR